MAFYDLHSNVHPVTATSLPMIQYPVLCAPDRHSRAATFFCLYLNPHAGPSRSYQAPLQGGVHQDRLYSYISLYLHHA